MKRYFLILLFSLAATVFSADTASVPVKHYRGLPYMVQNQILSRDGMQWIYACLDGKMRFVSVKDSSLQREIPVSATPLMRIRYSPDYQYLLVVTLDSILYRITIQSGTVEQCSISKYATWLTTSFSSDGRKCISYVPKDSTRILWDLQTGENHTLPGVKGDTIRTCVSLSADAQMIMHLTSADSTLRIYDADRDTLKHLYHIPGYVRYGTFSPDGKQLAIPIETSKKNERFVMLLMNVEADTILWRGLLYVGGTELPSWDCNDLKFSTDGTRLITGSKIACILWDCKTGTQLFARSYNEFYDNFTHWFSADEQSLLLNWCNYGSDTDTIASLDIASRKITILHGIKNWPENVLASGFSGVGEDLYVGKYTYTKISLVTGGEDWDSTVFWCGSTNREFKKKMYQHLESGDRSYISWLFSNNGSYLIRCYMHDNFDTITSISIFDLSNYGAEVYQRRFATMAKISPDKRYIWEFTDSTYFRLDLATLDTQVVAFALPDTWDVKDVDQKNKSVLTLKTSRDATHDSIFVWAGIWNLETGKSNNPFLVIATDRTIENSSAVFLSGANTMAITIKTWDTTNVLSLYDTQTGKMTFTFPAVRGQMNLLLTPDRRQLLVGCGVSSLRGIYCFDVNNRELLRYFKTDYFVTWPFFYPFSYNPVNLLQFMYQNEIWELPRPVSSTNVNGTFKQCHFTVYSVTSNQLSFTMPSQENSISISIHRLDGKRVAQIFHAAGICPIQTVPLPGLAKGIYYYRVEKIKNRFITQGLLRILQ